MLKPGDLVRLKRPPTGNIYGPGLDGELSGKQYYALMALGEETGCVIRSETSLVIGVTELGGVYLNDCPNVALPAWAFVVV